MMKVYRYIIVVLYIGLLSATSANASLVLSPASSGNVSNQPDCETWCESLSECSFCSDQSGCGTGFKKIATFRFYGSEENWYGCGERASANLSAMPNREMCQTYCRTTEQEVGNCGCSDESAGCGRGYRNTATFKGWATKNWYACRAKSPDDKRECEEFCEAEGENCVRCSALRHCGSGQRSTASFGGLGQVWYACELNRRGEGEHMNKMECEEWCDTHPASCAKCSRKRGCGRGYKRLQTFNEHTPGHNWYACERR